MDVSAKTIGRWEKGVGGGPDLEKLNALADIFQCSLDYIAGRTDKKDPVREGDHRWTEDQELNQDILKAIKALSKDSLIRKTTQIMQDLSEEERYKVFQYTQDQELAAQMKKLREA